jgi:hypothetical protein
VRAVSLSVPLALRQLAQWVGMQDLSFSVTYFGALVAREIVSGKPRTLRRRHDGGIHTDE